MAFITEVTKIAYRRTRPPRTGSRIQQYAISMGTTLLIKNGMNTKTASAFITILEISKNHLQELMYFLVDLSILSFLCAFTIFTS
jgi:hypothetical protein